MMNYYRVKKELFFNGEKIGEQYGYTMENEEPEFDTELYSGADLLQNIKDTGHFPEKLRELASWETCFFHRSQYVLRAWGIGFNGISRKLKKTDTVIYEIKYEERIPSIQEVMEYSDGAKAIQWLKDRGITACPMVNPQ